MKNLIPTKQTVRWLCVALILWVAFGSQTLAFLCIGSDCGVSIRLQKECVCEQGTCVRGSSAVSFIDPSKLRLSGSFELLAADCCSCTDYGISTASAAGRHVFPSLKPSFSALHTASVLASDGSGHSFEAITTHLTELTTFDNYSLIITSTTVLQI